MVLVIDNYDSFTYNLVQYLGELGADVRVRRNDQVTLGEIEVMAPEQIVISPGPGRPEDAGITPDVIKRFGPRTPLLGVCLGHQLLCLALGGRTYKMKFGHHGGNHPVRCEQDRTIAITSQNHGFAVDPASLPSDVKVTHVNLYDRTIEGLKHQTKPVFCVQYHPEAAPGPHDADYLFRQFLDEMERRA